jgi:hypothetical protein
MREWMVIGIGGAIGVAIGIVIGEVFSVFHGKILAVACGILGGCVTMGTATLAGWIKSESNTA